MRIEMKVEAEKAQANDSYRPVLFSTAILLEHVQACDVQAIMVEAMQKIGAAETAAAKVANQVQVDAKSPKPRPAYGTELR